MALGCWITLLVLTFDTSVQQIVAFDTKTEYRTTSNSIPFATSWNGGEAVGTDLIATATGKLSFPTLYPRANAEFMV